MAETLTPDQAFDIADSIQAAAAAALEKRRADKTLTDTEYDEWVAKETALRYDADRARAVGITLLANQGQVTAKGLIDAIDKATTAIKKVQKTRDALNILAGLVSLGVSITTGDAKAIVQQVAALQATIKA